MKDDKATQQSAQSQTKPFNPKVKLTKKQAKFVQYLLDNPKQSATTAAKHAYNTTTDLSARQVAHENLTKPNIIMALGTANELVESTLMNTVKEWGDHEKPRQREIAIDTAKYIHDKIHGKATQRIEQRTEAITLNIDLTGEGTPVLDQ